MVPKHLLRPFTWYVRGWGIKNKWTNKSPGNIQNYNVQGFLSSKRPTECGPHILHIQLSLAPAVKHSLTSCTGDIYFLVEAEELTITATTSRSHFTASGCCNLFTCSDVVTILWNWSGLGPTNHPTQQVWQIATMSHLHTMVNWNNSIVAINCSHLL